MQVLIIYVEHKFFTTVDFYVTIAQAKISPQLLLFTWFMII